MTDSLADQILDGDVRSASRLMRRLDDRDPQAQRELEKLYPHTGHARFVGVTGQPGSGKSTLVNKLIAEFRDRDLTVGCIAVDPTSPFSGGAILGDRVRMNEHALDDGVFIRSVATRGNMGGLSRSTPALVQVLDAMGFDVILIETVGVGQDEVDVVQLADTNVVVTVPGLGDDIQADKAGLMEIADIFVVNKSDLKGAKRLRQQLRTMLRLGEDAARSEPDDSDWTPDILDTVATKGTGVEELVDEIDTHWEWLEAHRPQSHRDRRRLTHLVRMVARERLTRGLDHAMNQDDWKAELDDLVDRKKNPYDVAEHLVERVADATASDNAGDDHR
jgi:LAO/AO transport system kinase